MIDPKIALAVLAWVSIAEAAVTGIQITTREVVADGMSFGDTGPYERSARGGGVIRTRNLWSAGRRGKLEGRQAAEVGR